MLFKLILTILACLVLIAGGFRAGVSASAPDTLSMRDVVDILADYEVLHPRVPAAADWYGITDFDSRTIYVIENTNLPMKRRTVVHEMLHAALRLHAFDGTPDQEEQAVIDQTALIYKALYQ